MFESVPRQFEAVPALAAAQVEDDGILADRRGGKQGIDLLAGRFGIFHHVAIGLEIQRGEEFPPPFGWQMGFEIGERAQRRARPRLSFVA